MKTAYKFKPGAGAILAFLILFVVIISIAGVVYIALNGQSKTPEAAGARCWYSYGTNVEVKPGDRGMVSYAGFAGDGTKSGGEQIYLANGFGQPVQNLGYTNASKGQQPFTFSSSLAQGNYAIAILTRYPQKIFKCEGVIKVITKTYANPRCSYSGPYSAKIGDKATVTYGDVQAGGQVVLSRSGVESGYIVGHTVDTSGTTAKLEFTYPSDLASGTYSINILKSGSDGNNPGCASNIRFVKLTSFNKCDLNADGYVNSADQLLLSDAVLSGDTRYDINKDGRVNSGDQLAMSNYLSGKPSVCSS